LHPIHGKNGLTLYRANVRAIGVFFAGKLTVVFGSLVQTGMIASA
jgi:hypothetical protein